MENLKVEQEWGGGSVGKVLAFPKHETHIKVPAAMGVCW